MGLKSSNIDKVIFFMIQNQRMDKLARPAHETIMFMCPGPIRAWDYRKLNKLVTARAEVRTNGNKTYYVPALL